MSKNFHIGGEELTFHLMPPTDKLQGFWLCDTVVSQQVWEAVMGPEGNHSTFVQQDLPVHNVSYVDALEFLLKLQTIAPFRLPTSEEWEHACRAGTTTEYWCGDSISPEQAVFDVDSPKPITWGPSLN